MTKNSGFVQVFIANSIEFCRKTTVHGLCHLVTPIKLERLFWLLTVAVAIGLASDSIYKSYIRYENNPVVVSINKDHSSWNITFPGTTWCFGDRLDEEKAARLIKRNWNLTKGPRYSLYLDFLRAVSESNYRSLWEFEKFLGDSDFEHLDLQTVMLEVNFSYRNYSFVTYTGKAFAFQEILTEEGICYSTSYIAPFLSTDRNMRTNLGGQLDTCMHHQVPCFGRLLDIPRPIKYYVHSPYEIPDSRSRFWLVQNDLGTDTYFSFLNIEAHSSLTDLRQQQRKCNLREEVFPASESPLYSFHLCQMNCRRKLSMELCKCVPHFYLKRADQPVCGLAGLVCLSRHSSYLISLGAHNRSNKYPCECYPSCSETEYILEKTLYITSREFEFSGMRYSWSVDVYPKFAVNRHVIFGFDGLLVNLGGIAEFFIGSSIISAIEIVYFFTIRLFRRLYREFAKKKAASDLERRKMAMTNAARILQFPLQDAKFHRGINQKPFEFKM